VFSSRTHWDLQQNRLSLLIARKRSQGRVLAISETGLESSSRGSKQVVRFGSGLDEAIRNVLYLPVGQLIAFERSLSKGLNPDRPTNLDSVVKLL
jgi:glucosamine--fructose-6-phosphate aminotransferase (isomerizing)